MSSPSVASPPPRPCASRAARSRSKRAYLPIDLSCTPNLTRAPQSSYADFQISDGTAGNAEAEANAVFVTPFDGVDLSTVDSATLKAVQTMREAAESAETDQFNPAISAASGDAKTALSNGKIKNKVLKLTGEVQALQIQLAQAKASGDDTSSIESKITEEQTKLTKNIATDKAAAGEASQGVTGGSSSTSSTADVDDAAEDATTTSSSSSSSFSFPVQE